MNVLQENANKEINSKLLEAAAEGNVEEISKLLPKGADVDAEDEVKNNYYTVFLSFLHEAKIFFIFIYLGWVFFDEKSF